MANNLVDTSMYDTPTVNPTEQAAKALAMRNSMLQNNMLQQDIGGREAASRAYKSSLNPLTGEVDQAGFARELANSPEGASKLTEYTQKNAEAQRSMTAAQQAKFQQYYDASKLMASYAQPLADDPHPTAEKFHTAIVQMMSDPMLRMDGKHLLDLKNELVPALAEAGDDPVKLNRLAVRFYKQHLINGGHLEQVMGQQSNIDTGAGTSTGVYDPVTKQRTQTGFVGKGLPPERVRSVSPDAEGKNVEGYRTLPAVMPEGQQGPSAQDIANTATGMMGGAQLDPAALNAPAAGGATQSPPGAGKAAPSDFVQTGPEMGQAEFTTKTSGAAGDRYNQALATAQQAPARIATYDKIRGLLEQGVKTGPTQEWRQSLSAGLSDIFGVGGDDASKFQQLQKYLGDAIVTSAQNSGFTGSNDRLDTLKSARANDAQLPQALKPVIEYLRASESAGLAKANAMQTYMAGAAATAGKQAKFEDEWRNSFNQKVFELKAMNPEEQIAFATKLASTKEGQAEAAKLKAKYTALDKLGAFR